MRIARKKRGKMEFFEETTTLVSSIVSVDEDGIGETAFGYLRYPVGHDLYNESECDVCNASEIVARDKESLDGLCQDCLDEVMEQNAEAIAGNYASYSLDTLTTLSQDYSFKLGNGETKLGNGEKLSEAYEAVLAAIKIREKNDYCPHGNFKWDENLCFGCEMGE